MSRLSRAPLVLLGLLLTTAPAPAQFGSIFGNDPPPRPPSSVPTRREPLPPPGSLQQVTPLPEDDAVPGEPMPLPPPPPATAIRP
ncbi:hypothetical protein CH341_19690, partial [Rhodoplanes roseus]